ncbi:MAG: methylaspartate mutase subunit S, partial [Bacteroidales bacterium]|nr:methylaspartate mutase subunit S [Bacteroidales bacterium]
FEEVEKRFLAMGFTKVYPPNTQLDTTIADLNILFSK